MQEDLVQVRVPVRELRVLEAAARALARTLARTRARARARALGLIAVRAGVARRRVQGRAQLQRALMAEQRLQELPPPDVRRGRRSRPGWEHRVPAGRRWVAQLPPRHPAQPQRSHET